MDQPDVNDLFPGKSTDELFPADMERERYRRQTLGTSPIQDLIFGNTDVNPVARVLDHFGQGFKQSWGDTQENLSKETEQTLKVNKLFDSWNEGRSSLVKAANDSLFRPAAVQFVHELHDAEALGRAASGLFTGAQGAVMQIGAEVGAPSLGREIAAIPEAFMGTPHPTGIPHPTIPDLPKANSLKVIGAGENGYFGTAPSVEVAAKVEAPKPVETPPATPFVEPRQAAPEATPEPGLPAGNATEAKPSPIAEDVASKLVAAGRPAEEAQASGQIIQSHYEARAERFGGARGTAEELYNAEGPSIKYEEGKAPEPSKAVTELAQSTGLDLGKELNQAAYHGSPYDFDVFDTGKIGSGEGAQVYGHGLYFAENPEVALSYKKKLEGADATVNGRPFDINNPTHKAADLVDEFGSKDAALKEINQRIEHDPGDYFLRDVRFFLESNQPIPKIDATPGTFYKVNIKPEPHEFLNWDKPLSEQSEPVRNAVEPLMQKHGMEGNFFGNEIHHELVKALGGKDAASKALSDTGIPGIQYLDQGSRTSGKGTHNYVVFDAKHIEITDKNGKPVSQREFELDQIKRGKIRLRGDAKSIITLFKEANASTFIHETGHAWLEELMRDAEHPASSASLRDDADTVREWLGVHSAEDIKTSHHEKFARGFERYMMEGKAPNQALAGVFARFKDWLTKIYQTVTRLKSPINDEIRGVFDRLLTLHPSEVKIEPEGPAKTFADIHEADAEHTPPEMAHPAAETIQGERDSVAARHVPEEQDARLKNTPDQARRSKAGTEQPQGNSDAAGTLAGEAGGAEASGAVGAGGIEAAPESPRTPARTEPPVSAHDKFPDKAGNIRLDNLNTPEELNQIIRQTAEENGDFQNVRGPISDAQVLDLAEAAGVDAAFIDQRKLGEAWTAPQIVALRRLLIQSAQSVHDLARKAAEGAEADVMAYAQAKARHQLIQERVSSVTAEAGRALRAFQSRFTEGMGEAKQVGDFLQEATGKTLFQLQQEAKFLSKLQTPQQTSKFIQDTAKGTFRNAILEYYINALISGPVTHSRYMVSNAINALWTPLVEVPLASVVGKTREIISGEPIERVHFGEAGAQLYGMIKGSRDGLTAAIEAFTSGVSPVLPTEKVSPHFAQANRAIPGKIGEILNIPSKSVAAIHSFFKALRYEQNVQALAYRTAANEGLRGDAFSNRVAELTTSPTEAMMTEATNNSLRELYMSPTDYHSKIGGLVRFTNNFLPAKIVVPFMKIGSQITRNAFIDRTPLGILDKEVRANLSSGSAAADFQAAKIAGGMALMATSVGLMAEGMMTGDGPEDPAKRAVWLLTHTPASIQIGDITFKYGNTGPLGMLMRFAANTYEAGEGMSEKDMGTVAVNFFEGFAKSVLDETFLRGFKDMLDAMFHPKEYGGRYIKSQITNWIPWSVGMNQVARKIDPYMRESKGIWQAAQAKLPFLSTGLMPRRDMFGEPIPSGGPLPDYANDPVIKAMDELHIGVGKIGKKIRGVDLNEQQYDDLARVAGRMAKTRLNSMVNIISNPSVPAAQRIEIIHSTISSSRESARSLIMMQNPEIIKQATDAKMAKLRGEPAH